MKCNPGEGDSPRVLFATEYAEAAPHPNPLRASFARLDPAKSGERERTADVAAPHRKPNRTPARASPPDMPIGVPSARQQAAPPSIPSSSNSMPFMPPPTVDIATTL